MPALSSQDYLNIILFAAFILSGVYDGIIKPRMSAASAARLEQANTFVTKAVYEIERLWTGKISSEEKENRARETSKRILAAAHISISDEELDTFLNAAIEAMKLAQGTTHAHKIQHTGRGLNLPSKPRGDMLQ